MPIPSTPVRRALAAAFAAALATIALTACGSSSSKSSSSAAARTGATAGGAARNGKFASCLKQHGVTLPGRRSGQPPAGAAKGGPPPGGRPGNGQRPRGGGFLFGGGAGANTAQAKKTRAALQACRKDLPNGGNFRRGARARGRFSAAALKTFTACVKRHGYTLPKPNTSGKGPVFPRSIESKPAFQKAARACASALRPSGGAAGGGSGG